MKRYFFQAIYRLRLASTQIQFDFLATAGQKQKFGPKHKR